MPDAASPLEGLLDLLVTAPPEPEALSSLDDWWAMHRRVGERFSLPMAHAVAAGFGAGGLGHAFASGYQAAGVHLFGPTTRPAALCATEKDASGKGSAHPSAMACALTASDAGGFRLTGTKSFVTLGTFAERFLVVASRGRDEAGRNQLVVVALDRRDGLSLRALPAAPFIPEIPHAELVLEDVAVAADEVLPGDGYLAYLKPFRTVEDLHVHGALLGWLCRIARQSRWPTDVVEELLVAIVAVAGIARLDPSAASTHVALGGAMARVRGLLERIEPLWADLEPAVRDGWQRDRPLLKVAGRARAARLAAAWKRLGVEPSGAA